MTRFDLSKTPERAEFVLPTPAVAGWTEASRIAGAAAVRAEWEAKGWTIASERRVRNPAFDGRGERTTFVFVAERLAAVR